VRLIIGTFYRSSTAADIPPFPRRCTVISFPVAGFLNLPRRQEIITRLPCTRSLVNASSHLDRCFPSPPLSFSPCSRLSAFSVAVCIDKESKQFYEATSRDDGNKIARVSSIKSQFYELRSRHDGHARG